MNPPDSGLISEQFPVLTIPFPEELISTPSPPRVGVAPSLPIQTTSLNPIISPQSQPQPQLQPQPQPVFTSTAPPNTSVFNLTSFNQMSKQRLSKIIGNNIQTSYQDKSKYLGTVVSGMRSGRGEYFYPNGDTYLGLWNNDKLSGIGMYTFNKLGQTYYGEFDNNLMHGSGALVRTTTKDIIYDGGWHAGLRHGSGKQYYSYNPAEYYEGNWINGNKNGFGKHFKDGNIYQGEWLNGKKHGKGRYMTKERVEYNGVWNHQVLDVGTIIYPQGDMYQGQIVNGLRQGKGRYVHGDGEIYQGMYMNDLKHGQGTEKKGNSMYTGSFENDMCHGYGTLIAGNGDKYEGQFYQGKKQGQNCSYLWKDGSTFRGSFQNDLMFEGIYTDMKDGVPRTVFQGQVQNI